MLNLGQQQKTKAPFQAVVSFLKNHQLSPPAMNHLIHLFTALLLLLQYHAAPAAYNSTPKHVVFNEGEDEEHLPWRFNRKLTWEDFKCAPVRNTEAVALTSTSLGITYKVKNRQFIYDINCAFAKQHSWGLMKTPYILAHEQGHFDITEIYARKLHQQMQDYRFNEKSFKQDISAIYQQIVKEKEACQERYDHETDHSRKKVRQEEWQVRIEALLEDTDGYHNYP